MSAFLNCTFRSSLILGISGSDGHGVSLMVRRVEAGLRPRLSRSAENRSRINEAIGLVSDSLQLLDTFLTTFPGSYLILLLE